MVGLAACYTHLPADVALSDHSRKFYDGTYKWDSEGFTDEVGVYREFDCYDPAARAPTPLPPMSLSDHEEDNEEECGAGRQRVDSAEFEARKTDTDASISTFADLVTPSQPIKPDPRMFSSPSELSDCPSNLSEWDMGKPVLKTEAIATLAIDEEVKPDNIDEPKQKPTTRGVAQKVKKGAKKPTARLIRSPPARSSPAIEPLQTGGSYIKGTGETSRRRSTRLSSSKGGK